MYAHDAWGHDFFFYVKAKNVVFTTWVAAAGVPLCGFLLRPFVWGLTVCLKTKIPRGAAGNAVFWGGPLYCKGADDIEENFPELDLLI